MRIKTQFILNMVLFGVVIAAISASAITTSLRVQTARNQHELANNIAKGASELSYLASDYVIYQESQQYERWQARYETYLEDASSISVSTAQQKVLAENIKQNAGRLNEVFQSVASAVTGEPPANGDLGLLEASWSRLAVQNQTLVSDADLLSGLLDIDVRRLQHTNTVLITTLVGLLVAYFGATYLVMQKRVLASLGELKRGADIVGSGNLDHRIPERKNDEVGDLSRSFNRMTSNLKNVTASRLELEDLNIKLEKEIEARKKAEAELIRHRDQLEEIVDQRTSQIKSQLVEIKRAEKKIKNLSKRVVLSNEKERQAIGLELHDEVGGLLTGLKLAFHKVKKGLENSAGIPEISYLEELMDRLMDTVSMLSHSMRPEVLETQGLIEALEWHFDEYTRHTDINVEFNHKGMNGRFPHEIEITAYRIVQEALTNVARYSGASRAEVTLEVVGSSLHIEIEDQGRGFDPKTVSATSMGIKGMQDRAYVANGKLSVYSSPGAGTRISCEIPLK